MSRDPVVVNIIRGETFSLEVRIVGENLDGATFDLACQTGIPSSEFTVTAVPPDTIEIVADSSLSFLTGSHRATLTVIWPDDTREVVLDFVIVVTDEVGGETIDEIIDGGGADTDFDDDIDGGEE